MAFGAPDTVTIYRVNDPTLGGGMLHLQQPLLAETAALAVPVVAVTTLQGAPQVAPLADPAPRFPLRWFRRTVIAPPVPLPPVAAAVPELVAPVAPVAPVALAAPVVPAATPAVALPTPAAPPPTPRWHARLWAALTRPRTLWRWLTPWR